MADCTLSSTCFCAENLRLVGDLKPFRSYEIAVLKRLLESAFTKLGGKNKFYYGKKAITTRSLGGLQKMEEGDDSKKGEDGAFEIYRTEMRLILLQDPAFVKDQFHEMRDVIQQGWKRLNKKQRLHFCKRAVLAAEDSATENVGEQQQQRRSVKSFFPDCAWLTNNIDRNAFNEYATITHAADPSLNTDTLWTKWTELTHQEREYYYQEVIQRNVHTNAKLAFIREKTKENPKNYPQYSAEAKLLHQTWNDLSDLAQQVYISKSYEKILEADQNPLTRFRREHYADKDYYCKTTFDDIASRLEPIEPYKNYEFLPAEHVDVNRLALLVYIEKMRPNLLKKKGMIQKRNWEVNYILRDQWNALNKEEQQPYYDTVSRYLEISKHLREWKIEARDFADKNDVLYNVDAETKKKHMQIALRNRKILVKKYPDLLEYFAWIKNCNPDTNSDKSVVSESSSDTEKADVVVQNVENTTNKSDNLTSTDTYFFTTLTDMTDISAFWEYRHAVETMTSEHVEPH